jgi:hypothetical protein
MIYFRPATFRSVYKKLLLKRLLCFLTFLFYHILAFLAVLTEFLILHRIFDFTLYPLQTSYLSYFFSSH